MRWGGQAKTRGTPPPSARRHVHYAEKDWTLASALFPLNDFRILCIHLNIFCVFGGSDRIQIGVNQNLPMNPGSAQAARLLGRCPRESVETVATCAQNGRRSATVMGFTLAGMQWFVLCCLQQLQRMYTFNLR